MFKKKQTKTANKTYYWFRLQSGSNILMTSEMYTTAAMRDKGIEAVKKVAWKEFESNLTNNLKKYESRNIDAPGWKVSEVKRDRRFAKKKDSDKSGKGSKYKSVGHQRLRHAADVFHIEDKKGKIKKR